MLLIIFKFTGEDFWKWQTMNPEGYRGSVSTEQKLSGIATSVIKTNTNGLLTNGS